MKTILSIPGYLWAVACFLIIPVTFIQNDSFARQLAGLPFMKVHPVYSGGELNKKYEKDGLVISVNHPVITTLLQSSGKRMVQVAFSSTDSLPAMIEQTIDYNFDDTPDFEVIINTATGKTVLDPVNPSVKSLWASAKVKENWVIRVNLEED